MIFKSFFSYTQHQMQFWFLFRSFIFLPEHSLMSMKFTSQFWNEETAYNRKSWHFSIENNVRRIITHVIYIELHLMHLYIIDVNCIYINRDVFCHQQQSCTKHHAGWTWFIFFLDTFPAYIRRFVQEPLNTTSRSSMKYRMTLDQRHCKYISRHEVPKPSISKLNGWPCRLFALERIDTF